MVIGCFEIKQVMVKGFGSLQSLADFILHHRLARNTEISVQNIFIPNYIMLTNIYRCKYHLNKLILICPAKFVS